MHHYFVSLLGIMLFFFSACGSSDSSNLKIDDNGSGNPSETGGDTGDSGGDTSGACGTQTGSAIAIDFEYVTIKDIGKYITLGATSNDITFNLHSYTDAPNINWSRRYKNYKYGTGGGAITSWILNAAPSNGKVYEVNTQKNAGDTISDPDDLMYVPDVGFEGTDEFTYCVTDSTGQSNIAKVSVSVVSGTNYKTPVGVPKPSFGIEETPPADPAGWPSSEVAGFFYIDSDHPSCSDSNTYGTPNTPRCSFPSNGTTLPAGGKIVLAESDNPYYLRDNAWHALTSSGTSSNPTWIVGNERGPKKPVIKKVAARSYTQFRIFGAHMRISGVVIDGAVLDQRADLGVGDGMVLRHSEVRNNPSTNGGGTSIGLSDGGTGVLALNVYAHDNGIVEDAGLSEERDIHAFVGSNQTNYWILDSRCDENAGDCVQLTNNNTTSNVYVGRLVAHSEGENCVDIKDFDNVVVSTSDCWDLRPVEYGNSGGNAQAFYVNDEGTQQNYVYMLNNRSWDTGGVHFGANNIGGRVYFIGNLGFFAPEASGISFGGGGGERHAYLNTISNANIGIYHYGTGSAVGRYMAGNLIENTGTYVVRLQSDTSVIDVLNYNFYTQVNGGFATGGSTPTNYVGLANFQGATGFEGNSLEGVNPAFADTSVYNFTLGDGSEVIDAVPVASMPGLSDFFADLGEALVDRGGTIRSNGGASALDAGFDER